MRLDRPYSRRMRYRTLGRSGLRVADVFLGTMTFGADWGWGAPIEECRRLLDAYAEAGGNVIDTANNYTEGNSERIVVELRGWSPFVGLQIPYSLVQREVERDLLPMADALGLSIAAWSPLAGGILSGKFSRAAATNSGGANPGGTRVDAAKISERDLGIAR